MSRAQALYRRLAPTLRDFIVFEDDGGCMTKKTAGYAKARFSELVRLVRSEWPQHVTVHGRDEVVVIAAEEFRRLKGVRTGQALIDALQASPHRDIDIEPVRIPMPVRDVSL